MNVRPGISVEGQTEAAFVTNLLAPHLAGFDVHAVQTTVSTGRTADGRKAKGGSINIDRVANELRKLLGSYRDGYVTSLYDFYGFADKQSGETVERLEARIAATLGTPRNLIPYVQIYEFEGLLLSDPAIVAGYFDAACMESAIRLAVARAGSPENVNDSPETAPSKRLEAWTRQHKSKRLYSQATKTLHGPLLAARLTLPVIKNACPRFAEWLSRLEALAKP